MNTSITAEALRRAASIKDQIDQLEAEYKAILAGESAPVRRGRKPGRKPGGAAKAAKPAKPAKAPKAAKEAKAAEPATKKAKKKRKLSPEARARIVAAVKARWAREKGEA